MADRIAEIKQARERLETAVEQFENARRALIRAGVSIELFDWAARTAYLRRQRPAELSAAFEADLDGDAGSTVLESAELSGAYWTETEDAEAFAAEAPTEACGSYARRGSRLVLERVSAFAFELAEAAREALEREAPFQWWRYVNAAVKASDTAEDLEALKRAALQEARLALERAETELKRAEARFEETRAALRKAGPKKWSAYEEARKRKERASAEGKRWAKHWSGRRAARAAEALKRIDLHKWNDYAQAEEALDSAAENTGEAANRSRQAEEAALKAAKGAQVRCESAVHVARSFREEDLQRFRSSGTVNSALPNLEPAKPLTEPDKEPLERRMAAAMERLDTVENWAETIARRCREEAAARSAAEDPPARIAEAETAAETAAAQLAVDMEAAKQLRAKAKELTELQNSGKQRNSGKTDA